MIAANKKLAEEYLAAGNRRDTQAQLAMLDNERFRLQCHAAKPLGYIMDFDELSAMLGNIGSMMQSFHVDIDQMTAEDDRVAVQAHSTATTNSGKQYRNEYHFLFTIAGGKITKIDEYLCSMTMANILDAEIWESAKHA